MNLIKLVFDGGELPRGQIDLISFDLNRNGDLKEYFLSSDTFLPNPPIYPDHSLNALVPSDVPTDIKDDFSKIPQEFVLNLVGKYKKYLPLTDNVLESADFVSFDEYGVGGPPGAQMIKKVQALNGELNFPQGGGIPKINSGVSLIKNSVNPNVLLGQAHHDSLALWGLIKRGHSQRIPFPPKLIPALHSPPTSPSDVGQGFSIMKLFKNDLRNRLKEETLEGPLLIHQQGDPKIPKEIAQNYSDLLMGLNLGGSGPGIRLPEGQQGPRKPSKKRENPTESGGLQGQNQDSQTFPQTKPVIFDQLGNVGGQGLSNPFGDPQDGGPGAMWGGPNQMDNDPPPGGVGAKVFSQTPPSNQQNIEINSNRKIGGMFKKLKRNSGKNEELEKNGGNSCLIRVSLDKSGQGGDKSDE